MHRLEWYLLKFFFRSESHGESTVVGLVQSVGYPAYRHSWVAPVAVNRRLQRGETRVIRLAGSLRKLAGPEQI